MKSRLKGSPPRVDVLGVNVSAIDMATALATVTTWVDNGERHYVCVTGIHGVIESQTDERLRQIHNESGLTVPDGMPMVWAGRYAGYSDMGRVAGPDLMPAICALAARNGWTSYFYGGGSGVPDLLAARLRSRFPGLEVVGTYSPPFRPLSPQEEHEVITRINNAEPDLVWVGLSTPKQEYWMASTAGRLTASVVLGVGAAFDIHAGLVPRAPVWMQRTGTEWLYRMAKEPRRLGKRYMINNPKFLFKIIRKPPRQLDPVT
jgi:N-acetylglucosaminyldiphosphoundecaprenol N-acetyl-beta-D-mannosaminyltransferase